jgi:hypothetical protein
MRCSNQTSNSIDHDINLLGLANKITTVIGDAGSQAIVDAKAL